MLFCDFLQLWFLEILAFEVVKSFKQSREIFDSLWLSNQRKLSGLILIISSAIHWVSAHKKPSPTQPGPKNVVKYENGSLWSWWPGGMVLEFSFTPLQMELLFILNVLLYFNISWWCHLGSTNQDEILGINLKHAYVCC